MKANTRRYCKAPFVGLRRENGKNSCWMPDFRTLLRWICSFRAVMVEARPYRFCKGFAFALRVQPSEVVRMARFARHIYASRSETSHSGAFDFAQHDGFDDYFRVGVLHFLASMAGLPFVSQVEIDEWLMAREALLDEEYAQLLREAIERQPFEADVALDHAIAILRGNAHAPWGSQAEHLRYIFWRLLADSRTARDFHLQLRPHAAALLESVSSTDDPDERAARARQTLAVLSWIEASLSDRLRSDFG